MSTKGGLASKGSASDGAAQRKFWLRQWSDVLCVPGETRFHVLQQFFKRETSLLPYSLHPKWLFFLQMVFLFWEPHMQEIRTEKDASKPPGEPHSLTHLLQHTRPVVLLGRQQWVRGHLLRSCLVKGWGVKQELSADKCNTASVDDRHKGGRCLEQPDRLGARIRRGKRFKINV